MQQIIQPKRRLSLRETQKMYNATLRSLKNMSVRAQMALCELYKVDPKNDIFKESEGIVDKAMNFIVRESLKTGNYERHRDIARVN